MIPIFLVVDRTGCFAVSDQPTRVVPAVGVNQDNEVKFPGAFFHIGVSLGLWCAFLI